jgi:tetratricopeptide (TPR) repeat protein
VTKSDRPTVKGKTHRIGRNGPCPCGSGRKFKHCCGAGPPQSATKPRDGLNVGPLSEVAKLREAADRFREARSALPAGRLAETEARRAIDRSTPEQSRLIEAERHRQLGMGLFETGKFAAATAALRRATDHAPRDAGSHHLLGRALLRAGDLGGAVDSLRLAIALKDDFAAAHLDLALALAATGRDREARAMCGRAIELAPEMAEGHRLLSELLEAAGASYEAAEYSRRAAALGEDSVSGRLDFVKAAALENNLAAAERHLREAIARHPNSHELHKALGDVLAKRGRFEEAIEACDRALVLNPLYAPAHLTAVQVRKCGEADRPRLTRMRSALREPSLDDEGRLFLHFAIGKLLDDIGQYREALRHFDLGNSIRHRYARFDRAGLADVIDRLIARYTAAFFEANREIGLADEAPLFIVGMPRSGTTLVEQIVSSHPSIAAGEELFFWSNRAASRGVAEATALTPAAGRELAAEYISLLSRIGPSASRVTDKQTFNFQQLGLIHLLLPKSRIIHCRRHPIDTCLSMYFTLFKGRMPFISDKGDLAFAYQQYSRITQHWRSVLPADCFLEVDYEKLVADREAVTRRLIDFCGLDWHDSCLRPERNERPVTTASLWQARQPVFTTSVARWQRYAPWLGELRSLLPAAGGRRTPDGRIKSASQSCKKTRDVG